MSKQLGQFIADNTIVDGNLTSNARQGVLQSKLVAFRDGVNSYSAVGVSGVVTTQVTAAATTPVPQTDLTAKGIYTGAVSGVTDAKRVLLRLAGTDGGINDGTDHDVYGVLTQAAGVYTLSYYTTAGGAYTFATSTPIDFYFTEIFDLYQVPTQAFLEEGVGGVIDSTTANQLDTCARANFAVALADSNLSVVYANGAAGIGATLTAGTNGAFPTLDGVTVALNQYVAVVNQGNPIEHGLYQLTQVGDGGSPYILTRAPFMNKPVEMMAGTPMFIGGGTKHAHEIWLLTASVASVGVDSAVFGPSSLETLISNLADKDALMWNSGAAAWENKPTANARTTTVVSGTVLYNAAVNNGNLAFDPVSQTKMAFSFPNTTTPKNAGSLRVFVGAATAPTTGTLRCRILADAAGNPDEGTVLATATNPLDMTTLLGAGDLYTFNFSGEDLSSSPTVIWMAFDATVTPDQPMYFGENTAGSRAAVYGGFLNSNIGPLDLVAQFKSPTTTTINDIDALIRADASGYLADSFLQKAIDFGGHLLSGITDPTTAQQAATKAYVDAAVTAAGAAGTHLADAILLTNVAGTYANGASGVGATITAGSNGAFPNPDGQTAVVNMTVLLNGQSSPVSNGLYVLTQVGDGGSPYILTRKPGMDTTAHFVLGTPVFVAGGDTLYRTLWLVQTTGAVGTDPISFANFDRMLAQSSQFIDSGDATKAMGLNISAIATGTNRTLAMADRDANLDYLLQEGVEALTLSPTDITNKYIDLAQVPKIAANTSLFIKGSGPQVYTDDFTVITNGSDIRRLNWNGLGLDGTLISGNKLVVRYLYA